MDLNRGMCESAK